MAYIAFDFSVGLATIGACVFSAAYFGSRIFYLILNWKEKSYEQNKKSKQGFYRNFIAVGSFVGLVFLHSICGDIRLIEVVWQLHCGGESCHGIKFTADVFAF